MQKREQQTKQTNTSTDKNPDSPNTFFPRVVNNTNIQFTQNEQRLLEKGPKYNVHGHKKNWLTTLALEAETAITHLPSSDRDYFRKQVATRIEEIHKKSPHNNTHPELKTLKSIQTKLIHNEATVASADKGNSLVILPTRQYEEKIQDFIDKTNFQTSKTNPTKSFQKQIRNTVNHSPNLIPPTLNGNSSTSTPQHLP